MDAHFHNTPGSLRLPHPVTAGPRGQPVPGPERRNRVGHFVDPEPRYRRVFEADSFRYPPGRFTYALKGPSPDDSRASGAPGPDADLVERVLAGNSAAIEKFADRMARVPAFLGAINRRRGSRLSNHDLDDLSQDVVIKVWNKLEAFHGRGSLDNWIYRFALLEFMNRVRKKSRAPRISQVPNEIAQPIQPPMPGLEELLHQLALIPEQEAQVIERHHFDGANFATIGEALGIPRSTAKTRYYRGLMRLREKLKVAVPKEWM